MNNDSTIVFAADHPGATISRRVERGELTSLARGVYTTATHTAPKDVVAREWRAIVSRLLPDSVITDRSAPTGGPVDGHLWLSRDARARQLRLPGLSIVARTGPGPIDGDIIVPGGGPHLASRARALLDNTRPTRSTKHRPRPTLDGTELDDWINRLAQIDGDERIRGYRGQTEQIAAALGVPDDRVTALGGRLGAALGTRPGNTESRALAARAGGSPYDPDRVARFELLIAALRSSAPQSRRAVPTDSEAFAIQAFYEAYFSNYIEGTTFTVEEAERIVFDGEQIERREQDSHDVAGTYFVAADPARSSRLARDPEDFRRLLLDRHAVVMRGHPAIAGMFKDRSNRAGNTQFVDPDLVEGTLDEGWGRISLLDTGWERAVYTMFLVAEVHPFTDGNGRLARLMMNAELVASNQAKIVVPTAYRMSYLDGLRRLSRQDDPSVLIKALRFLHDYTARIPWNVRTAAHRALEVTNAFDDDPDARLELPDRA